jgi:hypothetical protein
MRGVLLGADAAHVRDREASWAKSQMPSASGAAIRFSLGWT